MIFCFKELKAVLDRFCRQMEAARFDVAIFKPNGHSFARQSAGTREAGSFSMPVYSVSLLSW